MTNKRLTAKIISLPKWKKILFVLVSTVVLLRIGYIAIRGEIDKEYYTVDEELVNGGNISVDKINYSFRPETENLNCIEIVLKNISDDKQGQIALSIKNDEALIYQGKVSLANVNNDEYYTIFLNATISPKEIYNVSFSATDECTIIPTIDSLRYGYLREASVIDKLVVILLWLLVWGASITLIIKYSLIKSYVLQIVNCRTTGISKQSLVLLIELVLCFIIIGCSGIDFQEPTKAILYVVSIIASLNYDEKKNHISNIVKYSWQKLALFLLCAYGAFALVGQRLLIYPFDKNIDIPSLAVYAVATFWFLPITESFIYYTCFIEKRMFSGNKLKTTVFISSAVLLLIVPAMFNLYANNPGMSNPDTDNAITINAWHLRGMNDWQPFFYCFILRLLLEIWDSTYMIIFAQYVFYVYVVLEILLYVRRKGFNDIALLFVTAFTGFNASNFLHMNTLWKDIPYTLSILWAFIIIAKLALDEELYKGKWYIYIEMILALVGISLYRKNGIVTFIVIVLFILPLIKGNYKVMISLILSVACILFVKGPMYSYFEVNGSEQTGIYIGLGQDILGVYYSGGEVSEETLAIISDMTDYNNAEYVYNSTWSNQSYFVETNPINFILCYIDTFIKNPIKMSRAVINREDVLWDIYEGQDTMLGSVNFTGVLDVFGDAYGWNQRYPTRKYVSTYNSALKSTTYTAESQWISAIEWRCGFFTFLGVSSIVLLLIKKNNRRLLMIISPIIGQILSLLLTTGWAEFRYYWPLNLLNMFLILITLVILHKYD